MAARWLMATDFCRRFRRYVCGFCATLLYTVFLPCQTAQFTAWGAEVPTAYAQNSSPYSYPLSPAALEKNRDGSYSCQLTVPAFDQVSLFWESQENPGFSIRVMESASQEWGGWQILKESGQSYLYRIGGLFGFQLFSPSPSELTIELRAEKNQEAGLQDIQLVFSVDKTDSNSVFVMFAIMFAAGGVMYVKKRREMA